MRTIALWAFVALSLAACAAPKYQHVAGGVALGRSSFTDTGGEVTGDTRAVRLEYASSNSRRYEIGGRMSFGQSDYAITVPIAGSPAPARVDFESVFDFTAEVVPRLYILTGHTKPFVEVFGGVRSSVGDVDVAGAGKLDANAFGFTYGVGVGLEIGEETGGFTFGAVYRGGQLDIDIDQVPSFDADLEEILFVMAVGGRW